MTELKRCLVDKESVKYSYEEIIKGAAVDAVDRENRTHLNADNLT